MLFKHRNLFNMSNYIDDRHARAVKVSLNQIYGNTSAFNKELSKLITSFSHSCVLSGGSFLVSSNLKFFVVQKLLSNHWCLGWFVPSKIAYIDHNIRYIPNLMFKGRVIRKRINNPFSWQPSVNVRKQKFHLQRERVVAFNRVRLFSEIIGEMF